MTSRRVALVLAAASVLGAFVVAAGPAGATVSAGDIAINNGNGTLYATRGAAESIEGTAGKPDTFKLRITNAAPVQAQYQIVMYCFSQAESLPTATVFTLDGSTGAANLAQNGGYVTAPIAAHGQIIVPLGITVPKTKPVDLTLYVYCNVQLADTAGHELDAVGAWAGLKDTTTVSGENLAVTTDGAQPAASSSSGVTQAAMSAAPINNGQTAEYRVKITNGESGPTSFFLQFQDAAQSTSALDNCPANTPESYFSFTITFNGADITDEVMNEGTFVTPAIAPKKSVLVDVVVTPVGPPLSCPNDVAAIGGHDGYSGDVISTYLFTNRPAA